MSGGSLILLCVLLAVFGALGAGWLIVRVASWRLLLVVVCFLIAGAVIGVRRYAERPVPAAVECKMPSRVGELGAICGVRRPEDLELVASQNLVIASEERSGGRIMGLTLNRLDAEPLTLWPNAAGVNPATEPNQVGDRACTAPDSETFAPQGMSVLDRSASGGPVRVAVVAHVGRETIQFFDLETGPQPHLVWRGCIDYPPHTTGNGVAFLDDGSLVATNFLPAGSGEVGDRYRLRGSLGFDTGDALAWSDRRGWTHVRGTAGAMPNGIVAARDGSEFYFADAGNWRVAIVPKGGSTHARAAVPVGGAPDNLTLTGAGTILATVVTFSGDKPMLCSIGGRECRLGWSIWEVDPRTRSATEVFAHDGTSIGSATTALEVGRYLLIGTMTDDRVGVYRRY